MMKKLKFDMIFHGGMASVFMVLAVTVFSMYLADLFNPAARAILRRSDIAWNMVITSGLLTVSIHNVYLAVHYFLKWHKVTDD